jgi:hypothetical protein
MKSFNEWLTARDKNLDENFKLINSNEIIVG